MGRPVVYISPIAQHTKNIVADPRVSLTVMEQGASDDVQAHGRLTYIANAQPVNRDRDLAERYFRYFPTARQYENTHAFDFFLLEPVRVRFIGGFGQIFWLEPQDLLQPNPFTAVEEERIVQHMNQDHADLLRRVGGGPSVIMAGLDADGFDILKDQSKLRIPFKAPVTNTEEARRAFIEIGRKN